MPGDPEPPRVEVVYALPARQWAAVVPLTDRMTAIEAVRASGILEAVPELDPGRLTLGIFGRRVDASHRLRADDRVEIYRPLLHDPREARRQAAAAGGVGKEGSRRPARSP